jgi:hypothetical protein
VEWRGSWGDTLVAHLGVDEGALAPTVQPDRRPVSESNGVAAWTATLGADRLSPPVPRKRRNIRNMRNKAHFIGISCIDGAATSLNITRNRRNIGLGLMLRLGVVRCGSGFLRRNMIPLK